MENDTIIILKAADVRELLAGQERAVMQAVRAAYETHRQGASSLPHSSFLRFPDDPYSRIIALPAYLGGEFAVSGIKWIGSYPSNHALGLERASATIILNSTRTGRPRAILEGSRISAARTAASAALAATYLHAGRDATTIGFVGCGVINLTIARFLLTVFSDVATLLVYDLDAGRAQSFGRACQELRDGLRVQAAARIEDVLAGAALVSFATTAVEPHITDLSNCLPGATLLHISLRDLAPEVILACDNVVDDVDHICRAQTSVHLAEGLAGQRSFIRCTLADITSGAAPARTSSDQIAVFSPFGLGVLDLAVSHFVLAAAQAKQIGSVIEGFLP